MKPDASIEAMVAAQVRAQGAGLRVAAAAGALVSVAAVCLLGLSGWFITAAAFAGAAGSAAAQAFNYMMPSAVIRLLAILRTGGRYVERVAGHEAALKALARLRPQLFERMTAGPPAAALGLASGEASARLVQDVDAIQTLFVRRAMPWSLGAGAVSSILLAALAAPLAGAALLAAMATICGGAVFIARRWVEPAGRAVQTAIGILKARLSALEASAPELKAYGMEDWAIAEAARAAGELDQARRALAVAGGWMGVWQAGVTAAAVATVVPATAGAPLPMTALAALAAVTGVEAAGSLVAALLQNGGAREALGRLQEALPRAASPPGRDDAGTTLRVASTGALLTPPFRLGLLGPSGSGKTTLVEGLIGLRAEGSAELTLDEPHGDRATPAARRALFAYAAQDICLLDGTIRQNLCLAGPEEDEVLWRALEDAALGERVRGMPLRLDQAIGPNGAFLSGGERRRLGLARAYLRDAPWLVLDEPTEGLDAATEARVLAALDRRLAMRRQGLILISHRAPPMALCDRLARVAGRRPSLILMEAQTSNGFAAEQLARG